MEETEEFELHFQKLYKKFYSPSSSFGIFVATVLNNSPNIDKLDENSMISNEITVVGEMPEMEFGKTYIANVTMTRHERFGLQYQVSGMYENYLSSRTEQISFLETILTPTQAKTISEAYPDENIIDIIKEDKLDISLVKGVGEKTYQKIKDKIAENEKYQKAIIELTGKFGIPYNAVKRLSDKYQSPDILLDKVKKNPYMLTEVDGFGFKRVDEIALSMGVDKKSKNRILSCIEYVLDDNANSGHAWIKTTKAISDAIKLLELKIADVKEVLEEVNNADMDFSIVDEKIFLKKYLLYETGISQNLIRLLNADVDYSFDEEKKKEIISKVEERQGFEFTGEQLEAIEKAVNQNVIVVNGKAGTGKTSTIQGIVEVLKSVDGLGYTTCALSGKASQRIQESTGLDSFTIHRLLGYNPAMGWMYNDDSKLPHDIIILDEASMVNSQLFYYLLRAVKDGAKIIIAGDTAQLEPIGVGNVLVDILASGKIPSVELTKVHRQAQKSGILSSANMVRDGKHFLKEAKTQRLGELEDLYMFPKMDKDKVYNNVINIAKKYTEDIMDFQILVPMKNRGQLSTNNLNLELQKIFNKSPEYVSEGKKIKRGDMYFLEGDKVIINGNNYDKEIFNGTMGIIEHIDLNDKETPVVINFEGIGMVTFKKSEMEQLDLGYAITIHKSQGSQWKYVLLAFDYSSYVLLNRQLVYTGMTRARVGLFMSVEFRALKHSINTNKSIQRNTFLYDYLISA